jgi:hypothetical protein
MARRSDRRHTGRHGSALANASRRVTRARRVVVEMMFGRGGVAVIRDLGAPTARCEIKRTAIDVAGDDSFSRVAPAVSSFCTVRSRVGSPLAALCDQRRP